MVRVCQWHTGLANAQTFASSGVRSLGIVAGVGWGGSCSGSESGSPRGQRFDASVTDKGLQFLILEAGGDFKATPSFGVGPFVNFAVGHFGTWSSSVTSNGVSQDQSGDLVDTGTHEWLTIGLRGQYNL
jgi:hypothetical protein